MRPMPRKIATMALLSLFLASQRFSMASVGLARLA